MVEANERTTDEELTAKDAVTVQYMLAAIVQSSQDAIIGKDLKGIITSWNQGAEKIYGYPAKEIIGKPVGILVPPGRKDEVPEILEKIKKGETVEHYETTRQTKDGKIIHVSLTVSPIKDKTGKVIGASSIARDITARRKTDEERLRLAYIVESSEDAILGLTLEGIITSWNLGAEKMFGFTTNEVIGKSVRLIYPADKPDELPDIIKRIKLGQRIEHYETTRKKRNSTIMDVSLSISAIKDEMGEVTGIAKIIRDITGQKQASQYARSLIEASLDPLVTISLDGKITDVNEATVQVTGVPRDKLIGSDFSNYFTDPDEARKGYRQVFSKEKVIDYPLTIRHASGKTTDVLYNATVYKDDKGSVLGVFAAARDVTTQKQASQYTRSLIEASLDPLVTISPDGKITDVNEATVQVTGVTREKLIGSDFSNYFADPDEARLGYEQAFKEGSVRDYPLAIHHVSGKITDVLYNATVYSDTDGDILGVFAAARDVTERKKVEDQLHATSAYARSLIEASLDPLVTISPEGKIMDVNHATEITTGVSREWLIGTDFSNYFVDPSKAREGYRKVFKEGFVKDYPLTIRHSSGRATDVLYNASVYRDAAGKVRGVFAAARDVTETKKASQYARSLIEASLDPLVTISPEGKITDVNEATVRVTGVSRQQLIGTDFSNYFTEPEKAREGYQLVFKKGLVKDYPLTIRHSSGRATDVLYNASVYKDDKGNVLGVFAAARDVTVQKQASQEMLISNKEKEEFAAMISHELKTPVTPIQGYSELLLHGRLGEMNEAQKSSVQVIYDNAKRLSRLIQDILDVRKIELGRLNLEKIDVSTKDVTTQCVNAFEPITRAKGITLLDGAQDLKLKCDPERIVQVLNNLVNNAVKFVPAENGMIEINTRTDNGSVVFSVKDNGMGIPKEKQQDLFKRFYQADKSLGRQSGGTGLGLAICRGIIEAHGGKIWIESDEGKGTVVHFSIPQEEKA